MPTKPRYQEHFDGWFADRAATPAADALINRHMRLPEQLLPGMIPAEGIPEMMEILRLKPGDVLLDLGCGRGSYGLEIAARTGARLIGMDFSEVALGEARAQARRLGREADFRFAELTATGLPASAVDAVLCADAIGFPESPAAAFAEIRRVLIPGGRAVVTGWEARDHDDERLPSQARRMDMEPACGRRAWPTLRYWTARTGTRVSGSCGKRGQHWPRIVRPRWRTSVTRASGPCSTLTCAAA